MTQAIVNHRYGLGHKQCHVATQHFVGNPTSKSAPNPAIGNCCISADWARCNVATPLTEALDAYGVPYIFAPKSTGANPNVPSAALLTSHISTDGIVCCYLARGANVVGHFLAISGFKIDQGSVLLRVEDPDIGGQEVVRYNQLLRSYKGGLWEQTYLVY